METLLGSAETPEAAEARRLHDQFLDQIHALIFGCFVQGYKDGDLDFEAMCRSVFKVAMRLDGEGARDRLLGAAVADALSNPPPRRRAKKGMSHSMRKTINGVVDLVAEHEGLGKSKVGQLWERVAGIFTESGAPLTASQVYKNYYPPKRSAGST